MSNTLTPKVPPYSNEAEQSVLGCMLLDKSCVAVAIGLINEEDFFVEQNKWIFQAIKALHVKGMAIDAITIIDQLRKEGIIDKVGASYIADIAEIVPSSVNCENYCRIIREKSLSRSMITGFGNIISQCYEDRETVDDIIEQAESLIYNISMNRKYNDFTSVQESLQRVIKKLSELYKSDEAYTGIPTGFKDLDNITSGLQPSDLILIAARPSMGKTAFALNIAENVAFREEKTVAVFSLEMSVDQLTTRLLASESQVDSTKIIKGAQSKAEWNQMIDTFANINKNDIRLYIDDTSGISVGEMRSKCRKLKSTKGLDLIVIDYMQLMSTGTRCENRQQEISTISRELKGLAKELNCPVIALSQLSRGPESRTNHRPMLSDLRESGAIEQDADIVMLMYREAYYDPETDDNTTEIIIAKHRNGEVGTINLAFLNEYTKFIDALPDYFPTEEP